MRIEDEAAGPGPCSKHPMADWVGQPRVSNSSRDNTLSNRGDACARFLGYIRCCAFSTGKGFSEVSDFILLSTFVCVTKVINIIKADHTWIPSRPES